MESRRRRRRRRRRRFVCLFAADQVASDAGAYGDDEVEDNDEQYIYTRP